jgi:uncharacterized protein (DUF486 family)
LGASWLLVLPEYVLNVAATRFGYGTYSGAQMASFHLAGGVVCVALVSHYLLGERLGATQVESPCTGNPSLLNQRADRCSCQRAGEISRS